MTSDTSKVVESEYDYDASPEGKNAEEAIEFLASSTQGFARIPGECK
ncbi:hypothetical protein ACFLKB_07335 [Clostridium sp. FAM 1755]